MRNYNLVTRIQKIFSYILDNYMLSTEEAVKNQVAAFLLSDIAIELGIEMDSRQKNTELSQYEYELGEALHFVNNQNLYESIHQDPIFQKGKTMYLDKLRVEFQGLMDSFHQQIKDFNSITEKKDEYGGYIYSSFRERSIFLLNDIYEEILDVIQLHSRSQKRKPLTLPQQILLLDKIGFLKPLFKHKQDLAFIHTCNLVAKLLNQDESNVKKYIQYGSEYHASKPKKISDHKYLYASNDENIEIVNDIVNQLNLKQLF